MILPSRLLSVNADLERGKKSIMLHWSHGIHLINMIKLFPYSARRKLLVTRHYVSVNYVQ